MTNGLPDTSEVATYSDLNVIRRNGERVPFDVSKIANALKAAFLDTEGTQMSGSQHLNEVVTQLAQEAAQGATRGLSRGEAVPIETLQDLVELALMRGGWHKVAREYVLYREARANERKATDAANTTQAEDSTQVIMPDGEHRFAAPVYEQVVSDACADLADVDADLVSKNIAVGIYDGLSFKELCEAQILAAKQLIETEPGYTYVASRMLANQIHNEAVTHVTADPVGYLSKQDMEARYPAYFKAAIAHGVKLDQIDPALETYDLDRLGQAIVADRDQQFTYLGLQTFMDRYLLHDDGVRYETPQVLFMRVAMGLALYEAPADRDQWAIKFYNTLSKFEFVNSTPTLFNAGTTRPQCSSCYLTSVADDLYSIYGAIQDNAMLSKFAGGLGNDWTAVRALGAHIKGTNGKSQGLVPFLKVANDTAVAVNQGGRRKGAVAAYLETWHKDIEEFLDLRKNTGDDRRRTHDMNTANWIPDLFVKRVIEEGQWTLFSPDDVPDLHELYGQAFEKAYVRYEQQFQNGEITNAKQVDAVYLWRKMISLLFETGHPWFTFKDPCNIRSPQQHAGVIHNSNLCTEITLNTKPNEEIAVCNIGSVNLTKHMRWSKSQEQMVLAANKLKETVTTAMRMLDNVIEYNYYSVQIAKDSNLKHRPVGLGLMGFQDALYEMRIPYESDAAVQFADMSMEAISHFAIEASADLAQERGAYQSFEGSLWSQGILPYDTIDMLVDARGAEHVDMDRSMQMDWTSLREKVKKGMRNSNCMAIAPTATIANISGTSQSIEPTYQNLYVKSNLSGEFTVINPYLVKDLKALGLWDAPMAHDLKYHDGSVQNIDRIPAHLKPVYKTVFEVDPRWLIEAASRRQKWIDQSQSLNLYMSEPSGRKLDEMYKMAWKKGLKTTYYLRSISATHTEKSTIEDRRLNAVAQPDTTAVAPSPNSAAVCGLDGVCEACE